MTQYTWQAIKQKFENAAYSRKSEKKRGNAKYVGDAGYWDGGRCEYGAHHNLQEDCEKLASFFAEITELKNLQKELLTFNNQKEFETNKQKLLTKIDSYNNGLKMKTSNNTSIGGVCIIWNDFKEHFDTQLNNFRKDLELLKSNVERVAYNEAKELKKLLSDERKLQNEITENERKARNENDENKKKQFIFLANNAKDKWKKLLARKKEIKTSSLGDEFNPDQHIDIFLQALEKKLTPRDRAIRTPRNPQTTTNPNNFTGNNADNENSTNDENDGDYSPLSNNEPFFKEYWKELLLAGFFSIGVYYIYNQPE